QDEAVRVFRNFAQRLNVAAVLRPIDGRRQLVIRFQLFRLMREAVGVIQLDQFLPQPVQLGFLLRRQLLLPGHRRRRFLIILLGLRPGFGVILLRLPGFLVTAANQRIQILLPIIHNQPEPVALLVMRAPWNTAVSRASSNSVRAGRPMNVRRSNDLFHRASATAGKEPPASHPPAIFPGCNWTPIPPAAPARWPQAAITFADERRFWLNGLGSFMKSELKQRTLQKLADAYSHNELRPNPEYQRGAYKWSPAQKQKLIDSLLRGYQIPLFYIHLIQKVNRLTDSVETIAELVDGEQRLATIVSYIHNEFPNAAPGQELARWSGKKFEELDPEDKANLLGRELLVVQMTADSQTEVKDLFIRLQAGTPLTAQEKRDAFPGEFTNFVIRHAGKPGHKLSNPKAFFSL